jgi:hypothetical protein
VLDEPTDARLRMVARQGSADDSRTCVIVASDMKGAALLGRVLPIPPELLLAADGYEVSNARYE